MQIMKNYTRNENGEFYLAYFEKPDANGEFQPDFNKIKELEDIEIKKNKVKELIQFLNDTQFKFGDDYDLKDTPEWVELKQKRQEAREFIRENECNYINSTTNTNTNQTSKSLVS